MDTRRGIGCIVSKVQHEGDLNLNHPKVAPLAKAMDRTSDAIVMRRRNFDSLDDSVPGVALSNVRNQTRHIWNSYVANPSVVLAEARKAYLKLVNSTD